MLPVRRAAAPAPRGGGPPRAMALEGTIKDFGLPDIFQLIGLQRKTGLLTLKNEQDQVTVTFENGMVVMADSSAKRLEDRLGNVLVKQGKLGKERLEEALATQKQTLQRLGPHPHHAELHHAARTCKDALTRPGLADRLQGLPLARRRLPLRRPADTVDYDRENFSPMSADFILMEGIRMVDEWPIIEKKIPSMDIVFRPAVDPRLDRGGRGRRRTRAAASASAPRPAPPTRSASPPRRSASSARWTARAPCRAIIDSTASASSTSAACCSTS